MLNTNIIHEVTDLISIFDCADALGLRAIVNGRLSEPHEVYFSKDCFSEHNNGSLYLLRQEWIFGPMKFGYIENNPHFEPFYDLRPRVNFIALSFQFSIQQETPEGKKLGLGALSCPDSWMSDPGKEVFATPPVVKETYQELLKAIRKGGKVISIKKQRYLVLRHAREKTELGGYIMPVI